MKLALALLAVLAADDAPLAIEVRSGSFVAVDGGTVTVAANPDGGSSGGYLNGPTLLRTGQERARCRAVDSAMTDAGAEGYDPTMVIAASSVAIAIAAVAFAAGKLSR